MNVLADLDPVPPLKALADASRLRLLRLLDREELSVGELAACTGMNQSSVSRHLASLRAAGLVEERSEGVRTFLRLATVPPSAFAALHAAALELVRGEGLGHDDDLAGLAQVLRSRTEAREELFDRLAEDWDMMRARLLGGRLTPPEVASLLVPDGLRIVDAGAGTGYSLPWLAALAGPDGEVVAVEPSNAMRQRAAARVADLPNVQLRRGRLEKLPVEDGWADALLLCLSLGHTDDPVAALADCARVLRPGGRVAVADVERHDDAALTQRLGGGFAGFEPDALLGLLRAAGFERVRRVEFPEILSPERPHARRGGAPLIQPLLPLCAVGARPR